MLICIWRLVIRFCAPRELLRCSCACLELGRAVRELLPGDTNAKRTALLLLAHMSAPSMLVRSTFDQTVCWCSLSGHLLGVRNLSMSMYPAVYNTQSSLISLPKPVRQACAVLSTMVYIDGSGACYQATPKFPGPPRSFDQKLENSGPCKRLALACGGTEQNVFRSMRCAFALLMQSGMCFMCDTLGGTLRSSAVIGTGIEEVVDGCGVFVAISTAGTVALHSKRINSLFGHQHISLGVAAERPAGAEWRHCVISRPTGVHVYTSARGWVFVPVYVSSTGVCHQMTPVQTPGLPQPEQIMYLATDGPAPCYTLKDDPFTIVILSNLLATDNMIVRRHGRRCAFVVGICGNRAMYDDGVVCEIDGAVARSLGRTHADGAFSPPTTAQFEVLRQPTS